MVETTQVDKKKRFRPKKIFKKILGGGKGKEDAGKTESLQQALTVDTMPSNYEPPTPSSLHEVTRVVPIKKEPPSPKDTVGTVVEATIAEPPAYSSQETAWETFFPDLTASKKEEVPFDEKAAAKMEQINQSLRERSFLAKQNQDGDVEVDMIYCESDNDIDKKTEKKKPVKEPDPLPFVVSVTRIPKEENLQWKVLSDGTVEEVESTDAANNAANNSTNYATNNATNNAPKIDAPAAQAQLIAQRSSSSKRSSESRNTRSTRSTSSYSTKTKAQEEEKKNEDQHALTDKIRASSLTALKPVPTARSSFTSLRSYNSRKDKLDDDADPSEIMNDLQLQEDIHHSISKPAADPDRYVSSSFEAVPEVDAGDSTSLLFANEIRVRDNSPISAVTSPFGSTTGTTGAPGMFLHDDDDADTTFDLEDVEELEMEDDASHDVARDVTATANIKEDVQEKVQENVKEIMKQNVRRQVKEIVEDDSIEQQQQHYYPDQYAPRRVMARSPESLAAEKKYAAENVNRTVLTFSSLGLATASEDEADDERDLRSEISSPETVTDDSLVYSMMRPQYETGLRSVFSEDTATSITVDTYGTNYDDSDDDSDDEEDDAGVSSFLNFGHELSEMATELVSSGPKVLMEWMDLGPLK